MSMSELLKDVKLTQYNLEFCGMGLVPTVLHTDADVVGAFCQKRGVRRVERLDVRHCWLQEELQNGNYKVKLVDRKFNASDLLTVPPQKNYESSLHMISCHTMSVMKENFNAVKTMLGGDACSKGDCILFRAWRKR